MSSLDRADHMCMLYGECCTVKTAEKILGRCYRTVKMMLDDGRIKSACEGTMVDVRSIAAYIEAGPAVVDREVRIRKTGRKWVV